MLVREVRAEDYASVCALLAELGRPAVTADVDAACRAIFDADLTDPAADHLVAVDDDGEVVGFCSLQYRRRLNRVSDEAWVPDLIIAERLRGGGIGKALLGEAERRARAHGCHQLVLESAYFRTGAHAFYEAFGMDDSAKAFVKML